MSNLFNLILFFLVLNVLDNVLTLNLRHSADYLLLESNNIFKIPLKKRVIDEMEINQFHEFVSLREREVRRGQISKFELEADVSMISKSYETNSASSSLKKIGLSSYKNTQYTGIISVGNAGEEFEVIFDTGSANMWLNSKECIQPSCLEHKRYDYSKSDTFYKIGDPLEVQFGTGALVGEINADNIWIGGIRVDNQSFAMIQNEEGGVFKTTKLDGIVGLAYPSLAAYNFNPVFDNLIKQKKLKNNVFSFYFDDKHHSGQRSNFMLGGVDKSLVEGEILYYPVVEKRYWAIEASKILVNGKDVGLCSGGCKLFVDTGTSLITGPTDDYLSLISYFPDAVNCNTQKLPDITFVMKNGYPDPFDQANGREVKFTLTEGDYVLDSKDRKEGNCNPGFMPLDVPEPHGPAWVLGDTFLKKFVSIYDRDNDVVGLAKARLS